MSLFVTTQSYRDDVPTTYGLLWNWMKIAGRFCEVAG